ncbi:MAG TPA: hypothetical protein VMU64_00775 [Acidimicrobiales bacterium]|nr:hypothetical protein [Acidimicrobiales bacterium]
MKLGGGYRPCSRPPTDSIALETGQAIFVPAGEAHTFVDITEDFAALVVFAPPERG